MYSSGGALEYIQNNQTNPETEKWERLLSYIETQLHSDKQKTILEFGSGCGELAVMLQAAGYNIIATDAVDPLVEASFNNEEMYGVVLRAKGILRASDNENWYYFDYVAGGHIHRPQKIKRDTLLTH